MDIMDIYVIYDKTKFTKDDIKEDLMDEGYAHNFCFGNIKEQKECYSALNNADEVWLFGDVYETEDYDLALKFNKDIWVMG
jgi:hypothetical protein